MLHCVHGRPLYRPLCCAGAATATTTGTAATIATTAATDAAALRRQQPVNERNLGCLFTLAVAARPALYAWAQPASGLEDSYACRSCTPAFLLAPLLLFAPSPPHFAPPSCIATPLIRCVMLVCVGSPLKPIGPLHSWRLSPLAASTLCLPCCQFERAVPQRLALVRNTSLIVLGQGWFDSVMMWQGGRKKNGTLL